MGTRLFDQIQIHMYLYILLCRLFDLIVDIHMHAFYIGKYQDRTGQTSCKLCSNGEYALERYYFTSKSYSICIWQDKQQKSVDKQNVQIANLVIWIWAP